MPLELDILPSCLVFFYYDLLDYIGTSQQSLV